MPMRVSTLAGDTVADVLYRHLGQDNDELEKAFYQLNPEITQLTYILPAGIPLTVPTPQPIKPKQVIQLWD